MADKAEMSKEETKWQAESDACILRDAEVISNDPKRLKKAREAAKRLADKQREEADAIEKVAKGQLFYKSMKE